MRVKIYCLAFFLLSVITTFANPPKDTVETKEDPQKVIRDKVIKEISQKYVVGHTRTFKMTPNLLLDDLEDKDLLRDTFRLDEKAKKKIAQAKGVLKKVRDNNLYKKVFDKQNITNLPIGIKKEIGNATYIIGLDRIGIEPDASYLSVFLKIETNSSDALYFYGVVNVAKDGSLGQNTELKLIGSYRKALNRRSKGKTIITFNQNTSAKWTCNGFESLHIDAGVEFSKDLLLVEKDNGEIDQTKRVTGSFVADIENLDELIAEVSMDHNFQVRGLNGFGFEVNNIILDYSSTKSSPNFSFPNNYLNTSQEMWEGLYIRYAKVKLPKQFKRKGQKGRIEVEIDRMLIDPAGVTGSFVANDILDLASGDMNGWGFSVSGLSVDLEKSSLKAAGFNGQIKIPISESPLNYTCFLDTKGEYIFNIKNTDEISFDVFQAAKVHLEKSSYIEVKAYQDRFLPKAVLSGTMSIEANLIGRDRPSNSQNAAIISNIIFENLKVSTEAPLLDCDRFSFGSGKEHKLAKFPISLSNIEFKKYDENVTLDFDINVNFVGKKDGAFGGKGRLSVIGEVKNEGRLKWYYKTTEVKEISIDVQQGAFSLNGDLFFYKNDQAYGTGFQGNLKAKFKPGIEVKSTALFGRTVEGTRYWFADANATFPGNGLPVLGLLNIYGFGGGAYYHMRQSNGGGSGGTAVGLTQSGIRYEPDIKTHLGVRASIYFSAVSKQAVNGEATFDISFNKNGGIRRVIFSGNAYLMVSPQEIVPAKLKAVVGKMAQAGDKLDGILKKAVNKTGKVGDMIMDKDQLTQVSTSIYGYPTQQSGKGQISAFTKIDLDLENNSLHGVLSTFVNVAGGAMRGVNENGKVGDAVIHFDPKTWYIYIGTPDRPMGVEIMGLTKSSAYIMVGDNIPPMPPLPDNVSNILTSLKMTRDEAGLASGKGFAIGAHMNLVNLNLEFLMFYASLNAGAGFDIMIKNYGDDVRCEGMSGRIGVNGWYAQGQAYAYLKGKIGIKVNLKFYKGNFDIISLAGGAALEAKLPNPSWFRGTVGGNFNILGGLVKGNCEFKLEIGKKCKLVSNNPLAGIEVISDVSPSDQMDDVDVFTSPQAIFTLEVGKVFEHVDANDKKHQFRVKFEKFELKDSGVTIPGTLEWNDDNTVLVLNQRDILPPKKKLRLNVIVSFEENNGRGWEPVVGQLDNKLITEQKSIEFKTGVAPTIIPKKNVKYSYPVMSQLHYHKDEAKIGYIKLNRGQPYLFETTSEWKQIGRFVAKGEEPLDFDFSYDKSSTTINFERPDGMKNNTIYDFLLVNVPAHKNVALDVNVDEVLTKVEGQNDVTIRTQKANGTRKELQEKNIFEARFKSSKYATFGQKMNSLQKSKGESWQVYPGVSEISINLYGDELFDKFEINGQSEEKSTPLLEFVAERGNRWLDDLVIPLIYDKYSTFRVPLWAVGISQDLSDQVLKEDQTYIVAKVASFKYKLAHFAYQDYYKIRNAIANSGSYTTTDNSILTEGFPALQPDKYNVKLKYKLPGITKVTSEYKFYIIKP